ncbi:MAG: hypothetical protein GXP43_00150 [bacterium]|nr:hypothetical protein [bacterium]
MAKYLPIIRQNMLMSFKQGLYNPFSALIFIIGKIVRFVFFLLFLFFLFKKVPPIAGFDLYDLMFYFLVFNLIDAIAQALWRGVYHFDAKLYDGSFDYTSLYPVNTLFYHLFNYIDPLDIITLPIFIGYFIFFVVKLYFVPAPIFVVGFIISLFFSLLAVMGIHILAMSLSFKSKITGELLWIWRNFSQLGRVPVRIYSKAVYFFLLYIIPVAFIINLPARVWQANISLNTWLIGIGVDLLILIIGLITWRRLRRSYVSVSS